MQHYHICDKNSQSPAAGRWFSPGTPDTSTNKTDRHDITEILLKVALNTISLLKSNQIKLLLPLINTVILSNLNLEQSRILHTPNLK
jgi:hypothetical protein